MKPVTEVPVESVTYLPTTPLPLARPWGNRELLEFSRSRADSQALAASTTILARTEYSFRSWVWTYETPVARPSESVITSRAMAWGMSVRLPVCRAGGRSTEGLEKFEWAAQPLPHSAQ